MSFNVFLYKLLPTCFCSTGMIDFIFEHKKKPASLYKEMPVKPKI